jgi:hypothetical protein
MLNPIITPPRVPLVDPNTGLVSRAWYLFFLSLNNVANDVVNDPVVSPSAESLIASYDALLQTLTQEVQTQPSPSDLVSQVAELEKQIEALEKKIECPCTELTSELQKQIQALEVQPVVSQNALTSGTSILYGDGSGGFSNVAIGSGVTFAAGTLSATGSGGTVTSVTGTAPVASSGGTTPAISLAAGYGDTQNPYASKTANNFLAAPNGVAGVPTFRAIVAADVPTLNQNTTGTASNVTGTVAIANGGTGATTRQDAMDALAGAVTSGQYLRGNGTNVVMSAIQAADIPALPYNPTAAPATYAANFTVAATDVWIINNKSGSSCVVTLPTASANTGRVLYFQNYQNQTLVSASSNVVPLAGGSAGTAILQAMAGATTTLVSNGTNWIIMQYSSNNALQLE